ncbi:uncharacterized protein LOC112556685 [Pomacea canaliculata]|uniref:uncharacterized protein LOC112556685 n=1 Tax=Pomacea canaliculata TaxID=400727 RepID=UPI000D72CCA1|nr:uncharacterized protein LOC112556685 [Pomacea canaliculata]XP_025081695.1 uncharacterized protein LOC112556685 [Pomacea canaliculata]XP_025081697.1 uncharacterized protein LOC112556685 [Pomacea canaliculata]XP_025081698.1 uncharacterized protein LOC112556685 [Pomacea canaliculata]XP_025081699.1 uncharacterized protein LOC112556685 [Pomacea canaliculata]XP_025081700.1 uncharacterized protein LOC112556685 [Pomacea canaliculata]
MLTAENMIFMVAARFIIGDSSYDPDVRKFPLQVVVKLGHIGKTSLSIISTVNTLGGHAMITAVTQMVLIDRSTRRSTPLPEQWRQSYTSRTSSKDPLRVDLQKPPSEAIAGQSPYVVTVGGVTQITMHTLTSPATSVLLLMPYIMLSEKGNYGGNSCCRRWQQA